MLLSFTQDNVESNNPRPPSPKLVIALFIRYPTTLLYLKLCPQHTTAFITTYEVNIIYHRYIPPIRVRKKGLRISVLKGHASKSCNTGNCLCSTGLLLIKLCLMDSVQSLIRNPLVQKRRAAHCNTDIQTKTGHTIHLSTEVFL